MNFWTLPSLEGAAVDIQLSPDNHNISQLLTSHGIKFKVQIPDLRSAIERQNGASHVKRELPTWFEKYHPLEEVRLSGDTCLMTYKQDKIDT